TSLVGIRESRPVAVQPAPGIGGEVVEVFQRAFPDLMVKTEFDAVVFTLCLRSQGLTVGRGGHARYQAAGLAIRGGCAEAGIADDVLFVLVSIKHSDVFNT